MRFRIFALGLLLAGAAASCIREDMSQCRNAHELVLSYLGDGKTEIFGDKICRVEMYVFDAMNSCVADFVVPAGQVAARTAELPPLAPGDYRVVCLGNTHHTKTVNLSAGSFDAIRFADADYVDTGAASGNDSLYYASVPVTVTGFTGKEGDRTTLVPFVCYPALLLLLNLRWFAMLRVGRGGGALDFMQVIARAILVPGLAFWMGTLLRARLNFPRPYEQPGFVPLVPKSTRGNSCPSRHALSAAVLGMVWLYFYPAVGVGMLAIAAGCISSGMCWSAQPSGWPSASQGCGCCEAVFEESAKKF